MWKGWIIITSAGSKEKLEAMGVQLGKENKLHGSWQCTATDEALNQLDPLWGVYIWHLEEVGNDGQDRRGQVPADSD